MQSGSSPAVASIEGYLIVIGGWIGHHIATVELFQVKSRMWYKLTNSPQSFDLPSATICDNLLHVIGADLNGYSCSLKDLPSSNKPIPPQSVPCLLSWTPLPALPVKESTVATLCGQVVLIGGRQTSLVNSKSPVSTSLVNSESPVSSIHQLVDGQWVEVGSMTGGRWQCLVASPSPDKILIVGGYGAYYSKQDRVEECVV